VSPAQRLETDSQNFNGIVECFLTLRVYEAVLRGGSDTIPNYWRYPDVNVQSMLSTTIARYLMVGYTVELDYDRENDANLQHRHLVSLGVTLSGPKPKAAPAEQAAPGEQEQPQE